LFNYYFPYDGFLIRADFFGIDIANIQHW
jgi:hypothetical protein